MILVVDDDVTQADGRSLGEFAGPEKARLGKPEPVSLQVEVLHPDISVSRVLDRELEMVEAADFGLGLDGNVEGDRVRDADLASVELLTEPERKVSELDPQLAPVAE